LAGKTAKNRFGHR